MIDEIKTVSTVEELYKSNGAPTGEIIVDAVVDNVKRTTTHSSADIALLLKVKNLTWLSGAMQLLVGLPLQEFIFRWRLMQAIDLLDNPELSVAEVARRTGFSSENYLISVFRRRLGITPYAYRNGRYPFNQSAHDRKMLLKKAAELKSRNDEPAPEAE
jgi:AraC-like DNA-binding protein